MLRGTSYLHHRRILSDGWFLFFFNHCKISHYLISLLVTKYPMWERLTFSPYNQTTCWGRNRTDRAETETRTQHLQCKVQTPPSRLGCGHLCTLLQRKVNLFFLFGGNSFDELINNRLILPSSHPSGWLIKSPMACSVIKLKTWIQLVPIRKTRSV